MVCLVCFFLGESWAGGIHHAFFYVAHGDMKPQNILLSIGADSVPIVAKIDLCRREDKSGNTEAEQETLGWCAPEMYNSKTVV